MTTRRVPAPAATTPLSRPRQSQWWIAAVLAALAFVVATVTVFVMQLHVQNGTPPTAVLVSRSPGVFPGPDSATSEQLLIAIADQICGMPAGTGKSSGADQSTRTWQMHPLAGPTVPRRRP